MSFGYINIAHVMKEEAQKIFFRQLHADYMRIYDKEADLPLREQLASKNYSELAVIFSQAETMSERLDAVSMMLYKQNVYEIDALISGD